LEKVILISSQVANDYYNGSQVLDFANQIGIQMSLTNPIADEDNIRLLQAIQVHLL
jgi:hypothetical protein